MDIAIEETPKSVNQKRQGNDLKIQIAKGNPSMFKHSLFEMN